MQYHTIQSVLESMAASINDTGDKSKALSSLTYDQVDAVFDQIDVDNSGEIDADELKLALEKMGMKLTKGNVEAMIRVVDDNGDGVIDREEFHTLVNMATLRAEHKKEVRKRRKDTTQKLKHSILRSSTSEYPADTLGFFDESNSGKSSEGSEVLDCSDKKRVTFIEEKKTGDSSAREEQDVPQNLPRTYEEALPQDGNADSRAIIITEAKKPFRVVGVNKPWEDLCGYKSEEALQKSMSDLIQGPETNREGLKDAMDKLTKGADYVEVDTVNYRKDKSTFHNHLVMGPLYDDKDDGGDVEEGMREPAYYFGILKNIGELAKCLSMEEEKECVLEVDNFDDNQVQVASY